MVAGVTARLREFFAGIGKNEIVTTRMCLKCGNRNAVDQALFRMVKMGLLIRISPGVFMKCDPELPSPSIAEAAVVKAKAFGRSVLMDGFHAFNAAVEGVKAEQMHRFATDGASSSFPIFHQRIELHRYSARKLYFRDTKIGLIIRGLWEKGPGICSGALRTKILNELTPLELNRLFEAPQHMPYWMSDWLLYNLAPRMRKKKSSV